ncbi:MAG TPA: Stk1 family PASTA domain-containing Ser/Thr kinase [Gaiellaceae bacterium]|jgi:serine/threonine protein kinase/beta-lactam-binding protein with PASTA domain|nr:Stk1 family PASTA domain-containing Ser/Thr kinase [Gaiellaceae bacterium]
MATDPRIGKVFDGRYLIERKLGAGGMADVYLAEDQELGRHVALKLLNARHAHDEQFVERFRREAQSAAGLNHPNIVSIFDRGYAEDTYYIAMEYLDGRTLKELIVRNGPTPIPIAIDYARQVLAAIAFAHRHGVVHRDIKPHNVVVGKDGRLKVTDFGIARSGASQMTEAGSIVGTAQYLSPEQARGAPVDPRSDVYSLGVVLYEMLTGQVPFTGDAPVEIAMKHLTAIPEPPSRLRPEVPHDLDAVVMRALAKDPDERYGSAEEMDADLARVARGVSVSEKTEEAMTHVLAGAGSSTAATIVARPRTVTAPPPYRPPSPYYEEVRPRRSSWPWLLGLLAAAIAAGAGYLLYQKIENLQRSTAPVAVPDVGGEVQRLAVQALKAQGFSVNVEKDSSETVPAGSVINQDPPGGSKVTRNSTVTITVSTGKPMVTLPDVRGLSLSDALVKLEALNLDPRPVQIYSSQPTGTVIGEAPKPGTQVVEHSPVRINVSRGVQTITVPDVTGQPYANAKSQLEGASFVVARKDESSEQPKGTVIASDPQPGVPAPKGSTVTLTVSSGPGTARVPDVTTKTQADAVQILRQSGFFPVVVKEAVTDPSQDGIVLKESPPPDAKAKQGSTVTITVGQLVATTAPASPTTTAPTTTGPTGATTAPAPTTSPVVTAPATTTTPTP